MVSADPVWLQLAFDTLTGIFDGVGIRTNIHKIEGMVCRPCRAAKVWAEKTYTQWMIGE